MGYFICKPHSEQLTDFCADASRYLSMYNVKGARTTEDAFKEEQLRDILVERGVPQAHFEAARDRMMDDYRTLSMASVVKEGEELRPLMDRMSRSTEAFAAVLQEGLTGKKVQDKPINKHIEKLEDMAAESAHWLTPEAKELSMPFTRIGRAL